MTRFFVPKAWLGALGLAVGLTGMAAAWRWAIWVGVGLLTAAFVLRLVERKVAAP